MIVSEQTPGPQVIDTYTMEHKIPHKKIHSLTVVPYNPSTRLGSD